MTDVERLDRRIEALANALPGALSTERRETLTDLLTDDPEAPPVDVWRVWQGFGPPTDDELARYRARDDVDGFDPAEDPPRSSDRVRAANAYEAARDAGLEDAAAYLRTLSLADQGRFARFLRREYL